MFYSSCIESLLTFTMICWFGYLGVTNKDRLSKIVQICQSIADIHFNSIGYVYEVRVIQRATSNLADFNHTLHPEFFLLLSGRTYTFLKQAKSNVYLSFMLAVVGFLNKLYLLLWDITDIPIQCLKGDLLSEKL